MIFGIAAIFILACITIGVHFAALVIVPKLILGFAFCVAFIIVILVAFILIGWSGAQ